MHQTSMYARLSLKRAAKKLPQLILGSLAISAVVVIVVLFCAYSRNAEGVLARTRIGLVAGDNDFFRELAGGILGNMESSEAMLQFETLEEADAMKKYENGELEGIISFPNDFLGNIGRGKDHPAIIRIKKDGVAYDLGIILNLAESAERYLEGAESSNFSVIDTLREFGYYDEYHRQYDDEIDMTNMRVVLSREANFTRVTVLGVDGTTMTQSYACAALVMLLLLWGLSCGAMVVGEGKIMSGKLQISGVSVLWQELCRLVSLIFLLGCMLLLVFGLLYTSFPFAKTAFEQVGIIKTDQITLLLISFIPALIFAAAAVQFCFTAASNEIGGILLLFTGTIVTGYMSGCLIPSVYLPQTIRRLARFLPTTYMHKAAEAAIGKKLDTHASLILLGFALAFFLASYAIRRYKNTKV